jgi:hypothetical protein
LSKYKKACATLSYKAKKNYQITIPPPKKPSNCQQPSKEKPEKHNNSQKKNERPEGRTAETRE